MKRFLMLVNIATALILIVVIPRFSCGADQGRPEGAAAEKKADGHAEDAMQITLRVPVASPLFSDVPLASVNEDPITLDDLKNVLVLSHSGSLEGTSTAGKIDFEVFLNRLITVRLFNHEARNMGIDELPEIKGSLERFSGQALRQRYVDQFVKDVKADDKEIEKIYKENVKEWKIRSVRFSKEEDAKKMAATVKEGKSFQEAADQAVREGAAKGPGKEDWVPAKSLQIEVADVISKLKPGHVSRVIALGGGKMKSYSLIQLEDVRYPDNAAEREKAQKQAEANKRQEVLGKHKKQLYKKYVTINKSILSKLDYEAEKPGLEQLLKDNRTVATAAGKKITVGNLTAALKESFYHGADIAKQDKKINKEKQNILEDIIDKELLTKEALKQGIDKTREYQASVKDFESDLLFGAFIGKAVAPEVKATAEEKKAYYQEHRKEFTTPEKMKLSSMAFAGIKDAGDALEKLKKGADFTWMKENAEGQLKKEIPKLLSWTGEIVTVEDLPPEIRKALDAPKEGDFRLATSSAGHHYVLAIEKVMSGHELSYEQVEQTVEKRVSGANLDKIAKEWADRLRKAYKVTVYLVGSPK